MGDSTATRSFEEPVDIVLMAARLSAERLGYRITQATAGQDSGTLVMQTPLAMANMPRGRHLKLRLDRRGSSTEVVAEGPRAEQLGNDLLVRTAWMLRNVDGEAAAPRQGQQVSVWRGARMIALGILMAIAVLALIGSCVAQEARDDACRTENIYREAQDLTPLPC